MEQLYTIYSDEVEFRMIYIREAHAADSDWSVPYAKEKGINQQTTFKERCKTAQMLMDDKELTIPCLIDNMDNKTNNDYRALPDRVFLVRKDGRLAVASDRGPRGFAPGVREVGDWLVKYRKDKKEPPLPKAALEAALKKEAEALKKIKEASKPNAEKKSEGEKPDEKNADGKEEKKETQSAESKDDG